MKIVHVLAVIGGIFGILGSIFAAAMGGLFESIIQEGEELIYLGISGLFFSFMGMVGGFLRNKTMVGIVMIVAGIGGLISISAGFIVSFPCFVLGGIFSFVEKRKERKKQAKNIKDTNYSKDKCPACGKKIEEDWKVCPNCGEKLQQ